MGSVADIVAPLESMLADAHELVYINDNYGDWSAGRSELIERALDGAAPDLVWPEVPPAEVAFVVKAPHSFFYCDAA